MVNHDTGVAGDFTHLKDAGQSSPLAGADVVDVIPPIPIPHVRARHGGDVSMSAYSR